MTHETATKKLAGIINAAIWDKDPHVAAAKEILAAIRADPMAYVKPIPLTFDIRIHDHCGANSVFGFYEIKPTEGGAKWRRGFSDTWILEETTKDAEVSAQRDYMNRVGECFETP